MYAARLASGPEAFFHPHAAENPREYLEVGVRTALTNPETLLRLDPELHAHLKSTWFNPEFIEEVMR